MDGCQSAELVMNAGAQQPTAVDALKFGFPAGTVSGAPKIRAMEIIEELEPDHREFYAGAVVFFDFKGTLPEIDNFSVMCGKKVYIATNC